MQLSTDALNVRGEIEVRYTCDLDNSSPELRWREEPQGTSSYALVIEDRDVPLGGFTHWVIYNIPASVHHLPAGIPPQEVMPNGICQGINSFGRLGYAGPCPPLGSARHHYFFRLFALQMPPSIPSRLKSDELLAHIRSHILAECELVGTYQRMGLQAG